MSRLGHYILDKDHNHIEVDLMTWAEWFEHSPNRRVAESRVGSAWISTVFLGLDHSFGSGPPLLYETMIFGGALDGQMWRYSTWHEAYIGHVIATLLAQSMQPLLKEKN